MRFTQRGAVCVTFFCVFPAAVLMMVAFDNDWQADYLAIFQFMLSLRLPHDIGRGQMIAKFIACLHGLTDRLQST